MIMRRKHVHALAGLLALVLAFTIAGCTGDDTPPVTPTGQATKSTAATPTVDPGAAAEQQALAAYNGYIEAWAVASQAADPDDPNLPRYVADPLLSLTRHNIRKLKDIGAVQLGAQKAAVLDTRVDMGAKPPTATIHACLDYSALRLVYKSNQAPVPNSEIKQKKVAAVATVTLHTTGQWLVTQSKQGNDRC